MGRLSSSIEYDFRAARERQQEYIKMYRLQKRLGHMNPELEIEFMALIDEIEIEIAEAHQPVNARMTTASNSDHSVTPIGNIINLIVPQWDFESKEEVQ
ncbi:hypothetical protein EHS13_13570 [Paenibacillus psychroresistens]|uniref:Uncharacterized protein n=1 Tax=Paenibacillus psychroresistens TaxID=1778678 RepID=A0A6B8RJR9_9BACL|nr:hypothetical protein [Paenibacillus psychroresistens]QGQ95832.1 hypothetical protein EHS13_13570 [Paenibacillus psychroresistens]